MLPGSLGPVLHGRQYTAAVLLVVAWCQRVFHSLGAAGALLRRHHQPPTAVVPVALDGGLWLSMMANNVDISYTNYQIQITKL